MRIFIGIILFHSLYFAYEFFGKVVEIIEIGSMYMKHIRMCAYLDIYAVEIDKFMGFINVFLIYKMI